MIEQHARVIRVEGDEVWIRTEAQSGCHSCGARSGCGSALIARFFPQRVTQKLPLAMGGAVATPAPGDQLVLGIDEAYLQRISLFLYLLPLLGLMCGAIAGQMIFQTELASIVAGLSGLCLALYLVKQGAGRLTGLYSGGVRILRVERSSPGVKLDTLRPLPRAPHP